MNPEVSWFTWSPVWCRRRLHQWTAKEMVTKIFHSMLFSRFQIKSEKLLMFMSAKQAKTNQRVNSPRHRNGRRQRQQNTSLGLLLRRVSRALIELRSLGLHPPQSILAHPRVLCSTSRVLKKGRLRLRKRVNRKQKKAGTNPRPLHSLIHRRRCLPIFSLRHRKVSLRFNSCVFGKLSPIFYFILPRQKSNALRVSPTPSLHLG